MNNNSRLIIVGCALLVLSACGTLPSGEGVSAVLNSPPGTQWIFTSWGKFVKVPTKVERVPFPAWKDNHSLFSHDGALVQEQLR